MLHCTINLLTRPHLCLVCDYNKTGNQNLARTHEYCTVDYSLAAANEVTLINHNRLSKHLAPPENKICSGGIVQYQYVGMSTTRFRL